MTPRRSNRRRVAGDRVLGPNVERGPAIATALDMPRVLGAPGCVKVWQLAQLGGLSVGGLIAKVVRSSEHLPCIPRLGSLASRTGKRRRNVRKVVAPAKDWAPRAEPPALESLSGRVTIEELDVLVDHWALSLALDEHGWNVTRAARRLGISRRVLRERWKKAGAPFVALVERATDGGAEPLPIPTPPLAAMFTDGAGLARLRSAARHWLVACTLALDRGNRTHAAKRLGVSRRRVREYIAAYTAEREADTATEGPQ